MLYWCIGNCGHCETRQSVRVRVRLGLGLGLGSSSLEGVIGAGVMLMCRLL